MFKNTEKFEKWLRDNLKPVYVGSIDRKFYKWLENVDEQYGNTAFKEYELASWMTKSGHPECISFEVEEHFESYGCFGGFEKTYIF